MQTSILLLYSDFILVMSLNFVWYLLFITVSIHKWYSSRRLLTNDALIYAHKRGARAGKTLEWIKLRFKSGVEVNTR